MPRILNQARYLATRSATTSLFQQSKWEQLTKLKIPPKRLVNRYVDYYNGNPQLETSGRKIWTPFNNDTNNRWTGFGTDAMKSGSQGLYSSLIPEKGVPSFAEIEHYTNPNANPNQGIKVFVLDGEGKIVSKTLKVGECKSMFLFETNKEMNGIDLRLKGQGKGFLQAVFNEASSQDPKAFEDVTLEDVYHDSKDASFNRGVGNSVFEKTGVECIVTDSVRSSEAENLIIKGEEGQTLDILSPQRRGTFYVDPSTKELSAAFTAEDFIYNDSFEANKGLLLPEHLELVKAVEKVPIAELVSPMDVFIDPTEVGERFKKYVFDVPSSITAKEIQATPTPKQSDPIDHSGSAEESIKNISDEELPEAEDLEQMEANAEKINEKGEMNQAEDSVPETEEGEEATEEATQEGITEETINNLVE